METYVNTKTNILPLIPLRGKVAFPRTLISFEVGREMTLKAVERATAGGDRLVLICSQRVTEKDEISPSDLYEIGCVARIRTAAQLQGGVVRVVCEGLYRAKAREISVDESGYFYAVCDELMSVHGDEILEEAYLRTAKALVKDVLATDGKISKETISKLDACQNPDEYLDIAVSTMRVKLEIKQQILEEKNVIERLKLFERCLNDELEISKIEKKMNGQHVVVELAGEEARPPLTPPKEGDFKPRGKKENRKKDENFNSFAPFEKKNKNRDRQVTPPWEGQGGGRTKPSREERGYTNKRGPMKKDDWKQFFQHDNERPLRGPEPDFSEEGWARRKPKKH